MSRGEIVISSSASHLRPSRSVVNRNVLSTQMPLIVVVLSILGVAYFDYRGIIVFSCQKKTLCRPPNGLKYIKSLATNISISIAYRVNHRHASPYYRILGRSSTTLKQVKYQPLERDILSSRFSRSWRILVKERKI